MLISAFRQETPGFWGGISVYSGVFRYLHTHLELLYRHKYSKSANSLKLFTETTCLPGPLVSGGGGEFNILYTVIQNIIVETVFLQKYIYSYNCKSDGRDQRSCCARHINTTQYV